MLREQKMNQVIDDMIEKIQLVLDYHHKGINCLIDVVDNKLDEEARANSDLFKNAISLNNDILAAFGQLVSSVELKQEFIEMFTSKNLPFLDELLLHFKYFLNVKLTEYSSKLVSNESNSTVIATIYHYCEIATSIVSKEIDATVHLTNFSKMNKVEDYVSLPLETGWIFLDVESIGLYGEPFAFACEVVNRKGMVIDKAFCYYHPRSALGSNEDRTWVMNNCFNTFDDPKFIDIREEVKDLSELKEKFRSIWEKYHRHYGKIVADCPFPCEANFLFQCQLNPSPMPIYDIATLLSFVGKDPLKTYSRLPNESPAHNPYADIQQTKRLFLTLQDGNFDEIK